MGSNPERVFIDYALSVSLQPQLQPPHPLPDGQPMHFTPFFFALTIYFIAIAKTNIRTIIITMFFIELTPYFIDNFFSVLFLRADSFLTSLSAFIIRYIMYPTIKITARSPGKNPTPNVPVVMSVPT